MKYLQVATLFYLLITISCCNNKIPAPQGDIGFLNLQEEIIISPQLEKAGQYNQGKLLVSEGIEANYIDMLNYAIFSLIRLEEDPSN